MLTKVYIEYILYIVLLHKEPIMSIISKMDTVSDEIEAVIGRSGLVAILGTLAGLFVIIIYPLLIMADIDIPEIFYLGVYIMLASWGVAVVIVLWNRIVKDAWLSFLRVPLTWRYIGLCIVAAAIIIAVAK